jgi:hypothetical protein
MSDTSPSLYPWLRTYLSKSKLIELMGEEWRDEDMPNIAVSVSIVQEICTVE